GSAAGGAGRRRRGIAWAWQVGGFGAGCLAERARRAPSRQAARAEASGFAREPLPRLRAPRPYQGSGYGGGDDARDDAERPRDRELAAEGLVEPDHLQAHEDQHEAEPV